MTRRGVIRLVLLMPLGALLGCGKKGDLKPPPDDEDEKPKEG